MQSTNLKLLLQLKMTMVHYLLMEIEKTLFTGSLNRYMQRNMHVLQRSEIENTSLEFSDSKSDGPNNPSKYFSDLPYKQYDSEHISSARWQCSLVQITFLNLNREAIIWIYGQQQLTLDELKHTDGIVRVSNSALWLPVHSTIQQRCLPLLIQNISVPSKWKYF